MNNNIFFIFIVVFIMFSACARSTGLSDKKNYLHTDGSKLVIDDKEVFLRGISFSKSDICKPDEDIYKELSELNINSVRLVFSYADFYSANEPLVYKEEILSWIDDNILLADKYGMWIILQDVEVEGAQFIPIRGIPYDYSIWKSTELQDRFVNLWRTIAEHYHNETKIAGYSLFAEPVTSESITQWQNLAQRAVNEIRKVDSNHIVFIERIYGENETRRELSGIDLAPENSYPEIKDNNIVYEFYFFERDEYTHQYAIWREDLQMEKIYPDENWIINYKEASGLERTFPFTYEYLEFYLERQLEYGKKQNTPMSIWGFSALKHCYTEKLGGLRWLADVIKLFNDHDVHWTLWGYYNTYSDISENDAAKSIIRDVLK